MSFHALASKHFLLVACIAVSLPSSRSNGDDLYVSSNVQSGVIYKFTSSGSRSSFGTQTNPSGLAFDGSGNLFAGAVEEAGPNSDRIYKYSPSGQKTVFATGLNNPNGLAFDSNGYLFEADAFFGTINKFSPSGVKTVFATGLHNPNGLAFDGSGNLFVTHTMSNMGVVYEFSPDGNRTTFVSLTRRPGALAFDHEGNLFVAADNGGGQGYIYKLTPGAVQSTLWEGFGEPSGLAFDSTGNLFESDALKNEIYRFDPAGNRSTFATGISVPFFIAFRPVPEPSTVALLGIAIISSTPLRRRKSVPHNRV
jgi:sugar lactone lactonase YvrE